MSAISRSTHLLVTRFVGAPIRLHTIVLMTGFAACAVPTDDVEYSQTESAISVSTAVSNSCSTSIVRGLAVQIAQEADCVSPNSLVKFAASARIHFSSNAVLPYLHASARTDLIHVAAGHALQVNSGYRTVAQQYLLYRWMQQGRCGIKKAAPPGTSNHESGRAIDLSNWSTRVGAMGARHWAHDVAGDPVHFDHLSSPDNRGKDVSAFQRLWNRNHPGDTISVDGSFGPQSAARLRAAPAKGFIKGASCIHAAAPVESIVAQARAPETELLSIDGPDLVAPGSQTHYVITVSNATDTDWPATTSLVVADRQPSPLFDAATWRSPTVVGPIGVVIPAGGSADIDLDVSAPQVTEETPFSVDLALVEPTVSADQDLGTFGVAVTVTMGDPNQSADAADVDDAGDGAPTDAEGSPVETGGCSSGGTAGWLGFLLPALVMARRRRR